MEAGSLFSSFASVFHPFVRGKNLAGAHLSFSAYFLRYSVFLTNQAAPKSVFFTPFLCQFSFLLIFFSSKQTVSDRNVLIGEFSVNMHLLDKRQTTHIKLPFVLTRNTFL